MMRSLTTARQCLDPGNPGCLQQHDRSRRLSGPDCRTRVLPPRSACSGALASPQGRTNSPPAMPKKTSLDNQANRLIDRISRCLAEARQLDPATSALLEDMAAHLQQAMHPEPPQGDCPPLRVRTMHELQPVLTALRERCIREAATAALGAAAGPWLSAAETHAGASRLDVSKESRAQLLRMRAALSNAKGIHRRCNNR